MHSRKSSLATEALCVNWEEGASVFKRCLLEGSVICICYHCILRGLFSSFVVFSIPCWPAAGCVIHMTYFKFYVGVLHPSSHALFKVTVLHVTKRHSRNYYCLATESTSLACMFCFPISYHVMLLEGIVSFKSRLKHVQMYA